MKSLSSLEMCWPCWDSILSVLMINWSCLDWLLARAVGAKVFIEPVIFHEDDLSHLPHRTLYYLLDGSLITTSTIIVVKI